MGKDDYKPVGSLATFESEVRDILQLIFVLLLFGGMAWAVINIQHYDGYYTDGTL
jgi:flagellar biogenesis protein FliO